MRITREYLRERGACWSDAKIASVVPSSGVSAQWVVDCAHVSVDDRLWVLLHDDWVGRDGLMEFCKNLRRRERARLEMAEVRPNALFVRFGAGAIHWEISQVLDRLQRLSAQSAAHTTWTVSGLVRVTVRPTTFLEEIAAQIDDANSLLRARCASS